MSSLQQITDPELLRQAVLMLEAENRKLLNVICALKDQIAALQGKDAATLQQKMVFLQELLDRQKQMLFGASSERRPVADEAPLEKKTQTGHPTKTQSSLLVTPKVHQLDPADRTCSQCGGELRELDGQFESSEQISVLQRQFVIVQNRRQKYRCRCGACETALGPLSLREGARYSLEFAVEVAVSKYADHLPLDRQARIMRREGLETDSQTLWDQTQALATGLEPSYEALRPSVLSDFVIHIDETTWRLMDKPGSTGWWVWNVSSRYGAYYRLSPSRGTEVATEILAGFTGVVVADGYEVYAKLVRQVPGITLAACWAHVRRKFVECETSYPEQSKQALDLIRELYRIERACAGSDEEALRRRRVERRAQSQAIVDELFKWAGDQVVLKQNGIGRAIFYMTG